MASARAAERTFAYAQRPRDKPPVHRPSCAGPTDAWLDETRAFELVGGRGPMAIHAGSTGWGL